MAKIKRNDDVIVIAGRDKGKRGEVLDVRPDGRVVVSGINIVKKAQRPNPNLGQQGGIVDKEAPIDVSNVAIWNDASGKADRIGYVTVDGKKQRVFKSTQKPIDA